MTLYERILDLYPQISEQEVVLYIRFQNDGDGEYISKWEHPTLPKPTDEQLACQ